MLKMIADHSNLYYNAIRRAALRFTCDVMTPNLRSASWNMHTALSGTARDTFLIYLITNTHLKQIFILYHYFQHM